MPRKTKTAPASQVDATKIVAPDAPVLVCLECSKQVIGMTLHLKHTHGMKPDEYKKKHNLPDDYPMMAPGRPRTPKTGTAVVPYRKNHQELMLKIALEVVYTPDLIEQINKVLLQSGVGRVLEGALKNPPPIVQVYKGK